MKASELRIGNYIQSQQGIYNVWLIADSFINGIDSNQEHFNYEPIPLTEEWLEKFGFEFYDYELDNLDDDFNESEEPDIYKSYRIYKNPKTYYSVNINPSTPHEFCIKFSWSEEGVLNYIEYVHQLQNLYFALTGEELKIEL